MKETGTTNPKYHCNSCGTHLCIYTQITIEYKGKLMIMFIMQKHNSNFQELIDTWEIADVTFIKLFRSLISFE